MNSRFEQFDIVEVARKCGIQFKNSGNNSVEYSARCPFCGDTKYHLGLNRAMDRFHCFRCNEKGTSVSLYAKLHNISNKEAYKLISSSEPMLQEEMKNIIPNREMPIRPLTDRHNVYYELLSCLKLSEKHRFSLEKRGLSSVNIKQFMYRSIPTDSVLRREVLEKLSSKFDLRGIPGFYIDEYGTARMYFKKCGGIFIPVCNYEGYIQGLQMRLDVPAESNEKKFRWFSSKNFPNGTGAKPWIHVVGDTNAKEACLTEGPMKADVSSVLSNGKLFLAVPGVNSISYLTNVIRELGITKIYEAYDMDKRSSPQVKHALIELRNILNTLGVEWQSCSWNPNYKGLDDYFLAKKLYLSTVSKAA